MTTTDRSAAIIRCGTPRRSLAVALAAMLALAACGGGGSEVNTQQDIRATTTGKELTDLKQAYDSGVITQAEYESQRQIILNRNK